MEVPEPPEGSNAHRSLTSETVTVCKEAMAKSKHGDGQPFLLPLLHNTYSVPYHLPSLFFPVSSSPLFSSPFHKAQFKRDERPKGGTQPRGQRALHAEERKRARRWRTSGQRTDVVSLYRLHDESILNYYDRGNASAGIRQMQESV